MNDHEKQLLADDGWTIICESPFELSHEDGSTATKHGAVCVLEILRQIDDDEANDTALMDMLDAIADDVKSIKLNLGIVDDK